MANKEHPTARPSGPSPVGVIESAITGPLVVVSGPSGVGKTTVVEELVAQAGLRLRRAITATTRDARPGEVDGAGYHFWTVERFQKEVDDGKMLEHARVFGKDYYGTPLNEVEPYRAAGVGVILVIDVQGAARIRQLGLEHLSVFIDPPTFEELAVRLRRRGDTSEERIARRLVTARDELAEAPRFHQRVVNRDLSEAVRDLQRAIRERFTIWEANPCSTN